MNEDEQLLKEIAECCATKKPEVETACSVTTDALKLGLNQFFKFIKNKFDIKVSGSDSGPLLLIIDARCRSVALANRVKGGGFEYPEYYSNCDIDFMNLENIHVIRNSFQSLRLLCQSTIENKLYFI